MDLIELPLKYDESKIDGRFRLVAIANQRARQLVEGLRATVQTKYVKPTTVALQEIMGGGIEFLTGKDARQASKEARRVREEANRRALMEEDSQEIKRDLSVFVDDSPKSAPAKEKE